MAKVAAVHHGAASRLKRQHQIARSAAEVEHARAGSGKDAGDTLDCPRAPIAIDVERQQVIEQIIAWRDASEHATHPPSSLLLVADAARCRSLAWFSLRQQASASS